MLLCELFEDPGEMTQHLRQAALDYLTPLLSQNVPFITIQQMIDALRHAQLGLVINRSMVMDILNPDEVQAVDKIEGDRIYLTQPDGEDRDVDADKAEQDQQHVANMAADQAKKTLDQPPPQQSTPAPTA